MFLKIQRKILKPDNTVELKSILVEMEAVSEESTQEERTTVYYNAVRKWVEILSTDGNLLMWGQDEVVDAKLSNDPEYNLLVKSSEMDVDTNDIYLLN